MVTKEEAFQQYKDEIKRINQQAGDATITARDILRVHLASLQAEHHTELKAIRALEQKTKRSKRNVG